LSYRGTVQITSLLYCACRDRRNRPRWRNFFIVPNFVPT
jgi:hypothetical protein